MRKDIADEIINNILQLRIDIKGIGLDLNQAFRAVEKSKDARLVPKKVIRKHEEPTEEEAKELVELGFCSGDVIRCPNCNEYIVIYKLKYCMECGQALDWD